MGTSDCCIYKRDCPSLHLMVLFLLLICATFVLLGGQYPGSCRLLCRWYQSYITVWNVLGGKMQGRRNGCLAGVPLNLGVIFGSYIYLRGELLPTLCKGS